MKRLCLHVPEEPSLQTDCCRHYKRSRKKGETQHCRLQWEHACPPSKAATSHPAKQPTARRSEASQSHVTRYMGSVVCVIASSSTRLWFSHIETGLSVKQQRVLPYRKATEETLCGPDVMIVCVGKPYHCIPRDPISGPSRSIHHVSVCLWVSVLNNVSRPHK